MGLILIDTRCTLCNHREEQLIESGTVYLECSQCGGTADRLITPPKVRGFPAGWWESIGPEPIWIDSRKQLKKECDKHGCQSIYLMDS